MFRNGLVSRFHVLLGELLCTISPTPASGLSEEESSSLPTECCMCALAGPQGDHLGKLSGSQSSQPTGQLPMDGHLLP